MSQVQSLLPVAADHLKVGESKLIMRGGEGRLSAGSKACLFIIELPLLALLRL